MEERYKERKEKTIKKLHYRFGTLFESIPKIKYVFCQINLKTFLEVCIKVDLKTPKVNTVLIYCKKSPTYLQSILTYALAMLA